MFYPFAIWYFSTRDFHIWATLDIFDIFCVCSKGDVAGPGIW